MSMMSRWLGSRNARAPPNNRLDEPRLDASRGRTHLGELLLATAAPLPFFGYSVLVLTVAGRIAKMLKHA
jgi:hypothetical protein